MFETVSDAIDKMGLKWDELCGIATDGALAMTGERQRNGLHGVRQGAIEWR